MKPEDRSKLVIAKWAAGLQILVASSPLLLSLSTEITLGATDLQTLNISKSLRPISDQDWASLTQNRTIQTYTVKRGDTLSGISERLFGDRKYWPKIWAINHQQISNPHIIGVGMQLTFRGGTGTALPVLETQERPVPKLAEATPEPPPGTKVAQVSPVTETRATKGTREPEDATVLDTSSMPPINKNTEGSQSTEWRDLPRQRWENIQIHLSPEIDPLGFDRRSAAQSHVATGFVLQNIASSTKLDTVAKIQGARSEGVYLGMGDIVYLLADQDMRIGDTYMVTQEPVRLTAPKSDRVGYSYANLGTVRIVGIRGNLYLGKIASTRSFISRGSLLVKRPKRIKNITPIPGNKDLLAYILIDKTESLFASVQHKQVLLNVGSADDVKPGMVFRVFQHYDPANDRKLTDTNFIIEADIMVLQTSEDISTGLVLSSYTPVSEFSKAYLLTDLSDVRKNLGFATKATVRDQGNELDSLDSGDSPLTDAEKRELIQLERWKKNPKSREEGDSGESNSTSGSGKATKSGSSDQKRQKNFEDDDDALDSEGSPSMATPGSPASVDRGGAEVMEKDSKSTSSSSSPASASPPPSSSEEKKTEPAQSSEKSNSSSTDSSESKSSSKSLEELAPPE